MVLHRKYFICSGKNDLKHLRFPCVLKTSKSGIRKTTLTCEQFNYLEVGQDAVQYHQRLGANIVFSHSLKVKF